MPEAVLTANLRDLPPLCDVPTEAEVLDDFMRDLEARQECQRLRGLDTGFPMLNRALGGLKDRLYVLGAPPSSGKTTYSKQLADQVAELNRVPVLMFQYEQSAEELRVKTLSRLSGVNNRDIEGGRTDKEEELPGVGTVSVWSRMREAAERYRRFGSLVRIIEAGAADTVERMRSLAEAVKADEEAEQVLIIVDYLQIVPVRNPGQCGTTKDRVDWITSELKRLARDLDSPVLAISSMNRAAYEEGKPPTLAAFKESGGIEYSADVAAALWTDAKETERFRKSGSPDSPDYRRAVDLFILKQRGGPTGAVKMIYQPDLDTFTEKEWRAIGFADGLRGGR